MFKQAERDKQIARDIRRYGSPVYVVEPGIILAGANYAFNVDTQWPASRRYKPLTTLEIVNNSGADFRITVNSVITLYIPHTSQKSWDNMPLAEIILTNTSAVATVAGEVCISCFKPPIDSDDILREKYV